jgi:hypothetical protein
MSVISGVVGALTSSHTGDQQAAAATGAADLQYRAAEDALAFQKQMYQDQQNDPFNVAAKQAGTTAVNTLADRQASGYYDRQFSQNDFQNSTLYKAMMDATQRGADNVSAQQAASGMLGSGNMQNALLQNAQQNVGQYEPLAYGQWQGSNIMGLNALQGLAGEAQTQTNALGQLGTQTAGMVGNTMMQAGNSLAAGQIGAANAQAAGTMGSLNALTNMSSNMWNQGLGLYDMMNKYGWLNNAYSSAGPAYDATQYGGGIINDSGAAYGW